MTRLTLSRSLTLCKVRYSVQLAGVTPTLALCFSMSLFLTSFPLESGCKGTHFFRFCKYHAHFFSDFFHTLVKIRCKTGRYAVYFFQGNPEGRNPLHIIIYIITERTGKCQEKIRKTADDRKTESSRSNAKKGKTGVFNIPKDQKKRRTSETLNRSNPRSRPKILQYNAEFHLQTMSACLIKTFFRKKEHHRKGKIPLCFFPRKTKDQGKDRHLFGEHRLLLKKDRQLFNQTPLCI